MNEQARKNLRKLADAKYSPPDGLLRQPEDEQALNAAVAAAFSTPEGRTALAWLHQITTLRNLPETATGKQLRVLNAQRNLVAIIVERIEHGRRGRPVIDTSGE